MKAFPCRPRTEIMLHKQTLERDFKFKNRELAERHNSSCKTEAILGVSSFLFWFSVSVLYAPYVHVHLTMLMAVQLMCYMAVYSLIHFCALHYGRKSAYSQASELVVRNEPVRARVQIIKGVLWYRLKIYSGEEKKCWGSSSRNADFNMKVLAITMLALVLGVLIISLSHLGALLANPWKLLPITAAILMCVLFLGLSVWRWRSIDRLEFPFGFGRKLLQAHPELLEGADVEIYVNPKTGYPVGMFSCDHVDWFI